MIYELKSKDIEELETAIKNYRENADRKITNYLHSTGYDILSLSIQNLIPVSNRHKKHARNQKALMDREKKSELEVTVGTVSNYHYLYFPDDGTNTKTHVGNKHFFLDGAVLKEPEIINDLLEELSFKEE